MTQLEVTIEQGTLRGTTALDIRGDIFLKFKGIPYAKPPLGELRFKAPVPPEKWTGIFDATKEGDSCYARDPLKNGEIVGSENCLVLNVYTKKVTPNENDLRPVLFYIHGGGFIFGSSHEELYGPDFLLTEDVVLVTTNYRLGLLGFVSFEDPTLDTPGNAGLKDLVMALKWVQKNISKFGGDKNNVTIFGESAGGSSVHLLMLSRMAQGLFHKAIAQSGTALNPWVQSQKSLKSLAKVMNLEGADEKTVYNALIKKSVEEILEIQEQMNDSFVTNDQRPVGVVIEKNAKEPFLDDDPINIILSGKMIQVPFMLGYNSTEGMCFSLFREPNQEQFDFNFENAVPWFFGYERNTPEIKAVVNKIKKFYFGEEELSEKNIEKKFDMLTDSQFLYGIYVTIMTYLKVAKFPIYLYKMTIETNLNIFKKIVNVNSPGVCHGDDVGYLFKVFVSPEITPGSIEDISLTKFVKLWTNFAKFGNPTPDKNDQLLKTTWVAVKEQTLDYLDLGHDLIMKSKPDVERINFWKNLFAESPAGIKSQCLY